MKYSRNLKVFRGQLDMAPFAGVLFLLVIFMLLNTNLVFTPGVPIDLPTAGMDEFPGLDKPSIVVALDERGIFYCNNQVVQAEGLKTILTDAAHSVPGLVMIVHADKNARMDSLANLNRIARDSGIAKVVMALRPELFQASSVKTDPEK
jgi:biopolymer transport protein ExbD